MDGLRAARARRLDDAGDVEITLASGRRPDVHRLVRLPYVARRRVGIGEHRDGAQAQPARSAKDAARDLAAIGNQETLDHAPLRFRPPYIRNTPKGAGSAGALPAAASARASTRRVSRGSITPSSHSRADE